MSSKFFCCLLFFHLSFLIVRECVSFLLLFYLVFVMSHKFIYCFLLFYLLFLYRLILLMYVFVLSCIIQRFLSHLSPISLINFFINISFLVKYAFQSSSLIVICHHLLVLGYFSPSIFIKYSPVRICRIKLLTVKMWSCHVIFFMLSQTAVLSILRSTLIFQVHHFGLYVGTPTTIHSNKYSWHWTLITI